MSRRLDEARQLLQARDRLRAKKLAILGELFSIQRRVADAWLGGERFIALCCSRRAGKTQMVARLIAVSLLSSGRSEWTVFAARTLQIAKEIIWSELIALNERHELGWTMRSHEGTITTPTGADFRLVGVDDKASVEKVRGKKYRLVVLDEAATYQEHLSRLINDAFRPGLADIQGSLILSGTPGYVCAGYWFEAATGKLHYSVYSWTLRDNPHFPEPEEELASILSENKWTEEEPSYKREYLGLWVNDESTLVFAGYLATRNKTTAPQFDAEKWICTLGVDYGVNDATAFVVLGSVKGLDETYVLHASKHVGLLPDEVSGLMSALVSEYKPTSAVGDSGGLGKPYVDEWNRRHATAAKIGLKPADKLGKLAGIELVNGAFRSRRLFLSSTGCEQLEQELQFLPWYDSFRTKEHPSYPNHASDALTYAYREHSGYAFVRAPEPEPEPYRKWSTAQERKARTRRSLRRDWKEW